MTMLYNSMYPKIGINTSDATATAGDILSGKIAYGSNGRLVGTLPSVNIGVPSISVNASGLITATTTQSGGYVSSGTKSATHQLTTQSAAIITPGTSQKVAVPSGRYTTGAVTVQGSANLVPANIRSGVNIFGVTGTGQMVSSESVNLLVKNRSSDDITIAYQTPGGAYDYATGFLGGGDQFELEVALNGWVYAYCSDGYEVEIEIMDGASFLGPGRSGHSAVQVVSADAYIRVDTY